jgi:hypothetical protein
VPKRQSPTGNCTTSTAVQTANHLLPPAQAQLTGEPSSAKCSIVEATECRAARRLPGNQRLELRKHFAKLNSQVSCCSCWTLPAFQTSLASSIVWCHLGQYQAGVFMLLVSSPR